MTVMATGFEVSSPSKLKAVQVQLPLWCLRMPCNTRFLPPAKIRTPDEGLDSTRNPCKKTLKIYFSFSLMCIFYEHCGSTRLCRLQDWLGFHSPYTRHCPQKWLWDRCCCQDSIALWVDLKNRVEVFQGCSDQKIG